MSMEITQAIEYADQKIEELVDDYWSTVPLEIKAAGERGSRSFRLTALSQSDFFDDRLKPGTLSSKLDDKLRRENFIVRVKHNGDFGWYLEVDF